MSAVDVLADSMVLWEGEEISAGEAARRLRERWGSNHIFIGNVENGEIQIENRQGPERASFSVVPPKGRGTPDMKQINQRRKRERLAGPDFQDMARRTWGARA